MNPNPAPVETFQQWLLAQNTQARLSLEQCQHGIRLMIAEVERRYVGQSNAVRRIVQALLLNGHALLEGAPGEGKTTAVMLLSEITGLRWRRVQFRPDMLASDLIGSHRLTLVDHQPELVWVHGPVYTCLLIADEINRAPAKVQSALLETMQERQNSRLDRSRPETLYHPDDREVLRLLAEKGESCYGVTIPSPDDPSRVPFSVFATQNPIELEGTYPLSEAALDRFQYKLIVGRPSAIDYGEIARVNFAAHFGAVPPTAVPGGLPMWIRAMSFFERARQLLFRGPESVVGRLIGHGTKQRGLWDRVCLAVRLSHFSLPQEDGWGDSDDTLPPALRNREHESMARFLADWFHPPAGGHPDGVRLAAQSAVQVMLTNRVFESVESGSSVRGLLDWPRAAAAEALVRGDLTGASPLLCRAHFRAVADDVLRHRIRLTAQARSDRVRTEDVLHPLVNTLLPDAGDEGTADATALLP